MRDSRPSTEPSISSGFAKRPGLRVLAFVLALCGVAVRCNNGWTFPVLGSYDAFSHFSYIWLIAETGTVPTAYQGWSYFHPPLYYALMAAPWTLLSDVDPLVRLQVGKTALAVFGLLQPVVAWVVVRKRYPDDPRLALAAAALLLFVPVLVYSSGFLGNEGVAATLCGLALFAVLRVLERPTALRALVLGLVLGLAMLGKFSAVTIVAASLGAIALRAVWQRSARCDGRALAIATLAAVVVCGPYYAGNVALYGTPFQLARDATFLTAYVEGNQPQAARGWADYLLFDPLVFFRPVWPRGATPSEDAAPHGWERSMRESVWTGLYANTWFDGFGGWVLPPVTESERARRAGQFLLCLGVVPTALVLLGAGAGAWRLRRRGWDDQVVVFGLTTIAMLGLFVFGTRSVPIAAAVKATYLTPASVAFAFWFALGLSVVRDRRPSWLAPILVACSVLAVASLLVFWQGLLFESRSWKSAIPRYDVSLQNQYGVVEYAGGRRERARDVFREAAAADYHLAVENLAYLEVEDGRLREGLRLLRRAAQLQREQADGGSVGRDEFLRLSAAESQHSIGVVLYRLGRRQKAVAAWTRALANDPVHAQALWNLTLARLADGLAGAGDDEALRQAALADAARALTNVRRFDPGFDEGWLLAASVARLRGGCDAAADIVEQWKDVSCWTRPRYPVPAGNGAGLSAAVGRRQLVAIRRAELEPARALSACGLEQR